MKNLIIYLTMSFSLFVTKMHAQESFEKRVKQIAEKIETATNQEKDALKKEVEAVNAQLQAGTITAAQAEEQKKMLAEKRANNIEKRVTEYQTELNQLVQMKVDGKIIDTDSTEAKAGFTFVWPGEYRSKSDSIKRFKPEARTTSQFVFAAGVNNLVTDGAVANSDFRYWGSHFYEWGISYNTRIAKNHNLLHFKYGLSLMYNNLRPTDNRLFVPNGNTTDLQVNPVNMRDSRFRNVNLVVPMHLEFDFSGKKIKNGKTYFRTHESVRFGIGGYAGVNVKSKQIINYDLDGYKSREVTKGNFNTNDFIYGLSTYIGYGETSLYLKYDLNPLFKNNAVDQNNISLGIRFDFN